MNKFIKLLIFLITFSFVNNNGSDISSKFIKSLILSSVKGLWGATKSMVETGVDQGSKFVIDGYNYLETEAPKFANEKYNALKSGSMDLFEEIQMRVKEQQLQDSLACSEIPELLSETQLNSSYLDYIRSKWNSGVKYSKEAAIVLKEKLQTVPVKKYAVGLLTVYIAYRSAKFIWNKIANRTASNEVKVIVEIKTDKSSNVQSYSVKGV